MPLARDIRRAMIRSRRLQEKRNAEAEAEEHARQAQLAQAGKMRRAYAQENKMLARPALNKEVSTVEPEPEAEPQAPSLEGVSFASATAHTLAEGAGLDATDFDGFTPTAARGYTAADVRALIAFDEGEG
jgi:hypothetical protein